MRYPWPKILRSKSAPRSDFLSMEVEDCREEKGRGHLVSVIAQLKFCAVTMVALLITEYAEVTQTVIALMEIATIHFWNAGKFLGIVCSRKYCC